MINTFDHLFLFHHQVPTTLLKGLSLLSDPKLTLLCLGLFSLYLLIKKGVIAFSSPVLYLFACTGFIMFFCGVIKIGAGRARPFMLEEGIVGFFFFSIKHSYLSFPSSHSALSMCLVQALRKRFAISPLFYCYPVAIGMCRILLHAHFATDVLVGFAVGVAVETLLSKYYEKIILGIKKLGSPKAS